MGKPTDKTQKFHLLHSEAVADYLRTHPDFLLQHPELLEELSIPHATPDGVVSLIETQVKILRQNLKELKNENILLGKIDTENRRLISRLHLAMQDNLKYNSPEQVFYSLREILVEQFAADQIRLYIFTPNKNIINFDDIHVTGAKDKLQSMFSSLFNDEKPICGSLQDEHIKALFGDQAKAVHSTILVPLKQPLWKGLLAIGSQQWNCYRYGIPLGVMVLIVKMAAIHLNTWFEIRP